METYYRRMKKIQILLPEPLERDLRLITKSLDISIAEILRRGGEYMRDCHKVILDSHTSEKNTSWHLPKPKALGTFKSDVSAWREIANNSTKDE